MAISGKEFLGKGINALRVANPGEVCAVCGKPFTADHPKNYSFGEDEHGNGGKSANSDCYFNNLGEEIEKHPIVNPETVMRMIARKRGEA